MALAAPGPLPKNRKSFTYQELTLLALRCQLLHLEARELQVFLLSRYSCCNPPFTGTSASSSACGADSQQAAYERLFIADSGGETGHVRPILKAARVVIPAGLAGRMLPRLVRVCACICAVREVTTYRKSRKSCDRFVVINIQQPQGWRRHLATLTLRIAELPDKHRAARPRTPTRCAKQ